MPPYFKQDNPATCSLAVLRMVLASYSIEVSEEELLNKIKSDYGLKFSNIWNSTIAKLACQYGIKTTMHALWPLFKPDILKKAVAEYYDHPDQFDVYKYENPNDSDNLPEPLLLAYKEMFKAIEEGCKVSYGSLTIRRLQTLLEEGKLIQTSVKVHELYDYAPKGFHSILIFKLSGKQIKYHDPSVGSNLTINTETFTKAATDVDAFISYARGSTDTVVSTHTLH